MVADLHCHSRYSDGVEPPAELVRSAAAAGLSVLALTDHDSLEGVSEARAAAAALGTGRLEIVAGVELSCEDAGEEIHLLGLFVDDDPAAPLARRLAAIRETRLQRGEAMVGQLAAAGCPLDLEAIRATVGGEGSFGRPHIARALVAAGFALDLDDAFRRWLSPGRPGFLGKPRLAAREALDLVHRAGGVVSLAHPIWSREPDEVIRRLASLGLDGVEASHPDQSPEFEARMRALAGELSLAVSAGSDFHEPGRGRSVGVRRAAGGEVEALRERRPA